jgi:uncharacterized Tic20 family protein
VKTGHSPWPPFRQLRQAERGNGGEAGISNTLKAKNVFFQMSALQTLRDLGTLAVTKLSRMSTAYELDQELNEMAERELRRDHASPPKEIAVRTHIQDGFRDEKNIAVATHIGTVAAALFSGGFLDVIVPAVAYVAFKDKSEMLRSHIKEQLNFQLTMLLVTVIGVIFSVVTFGLGAVLAVPVILFFFVVDIVCSIRAAMAASRGEAYRFPFTIDFVK